MPQYKKVEIPKEIWNFFNEEQGLTKEILTQSIDIELNKYLFGWGEFFISEKLHYIVNFRGFDLIRYYRDHSPSFSINDLLQYDRYAIREFIVFDTQFKFHNWLLKNQLIIPHKLVCSGLGSQCHLIPSLCHESGLEYLNRYINKFSMNERQKKFNELIEQDKGPPFNILLEKELSDVLAEPHEVSWNTINNRFLKFKEKEQEREISLASKHTRNGSDSLFWKAAKSVAKYDLPTTTLPEEAIVAVDDAKTLKFL